MSRLVLITGASRGIGHTLAVESLKRFKQDTVFLLIARDLDKLEQVRQEMSSLLNASASNNKIFLMRIDFSQPHRMDDYVALLKHDFLNFIEESSNRSLFKELYAFYNHGTLLLGKVSDISDRVGPEFQINVISVWQLMNALLKQFPIQECPIQFHINISSLLSTQIEKFFSPYSATRCARATVFKSLALEMPELRVLNYQPGPVYTDMLKQIYDDKSADLSGPNNFRNEYDKGNMIQPEATVNRLWDIIQSNRFESGSSIDFFDQIQ